MNPSFHPYSLSKQLRSVQQPPVLEPPFEEEHHDSHPYPTQCVEAMETVFLEPMTAAPDVALGESVNEIKMAAGSIADDVELIAVDEVDIPFMEGVEVAVR